MEIVKKNAKPIAITAGVAAGILGLYLLYKRSSSTKFKTRVLTDKEKDDMISQIKVIYNGSILSVDTAVEIYDVISTIAVSETLPIKSKLKKERRKKRGNLTQYAETCKKYLIQSDGIMEKWEKETFQRLRIPETLLDQSVHHYLNQNNKKIRDLSTKMQQDRANVNESTKAISWEEFRIFAKRLTELFEAEFNNLSSIKVAVKHPEYVASVINFKVYDVIYDEFGLSDEDIIVTLTTHNKKLQTEDPELMTRFLNICQAINTVNSQPF